MDQITPAVKKQLFELFKEAQLKKQRETYAKRKLAGTNKQLKPTEQKIKPGPKISTPIITTTAKNKITKSQITNSKIKNTNK